MKISKRKIFGWAKAVIIIYCGVGIALYYLQEKFIFHPKKLAHDHVLQIRDRFKEMFIPVNKEDTISLVKFFPSDSTPRGLVLYFHGNMDNVERYAPYAAQFTKKGFEVWMPDYPGYGKTSGMRTEKKLYQQAYLLRKLANATFNKGQVIVYGKSFGTGIAAYVASSSDCRALVLETPYYSIPDIMAAYAPIYPVSLMSTYKIPTWQFLEEVKGPVTIVHGTNDEVIPFRSAVKLKSFLKAGDRFLEIKDGKHNNLAGFKEYQVLVDSILN